MNTDWIVLKFGGSSQSLSGYNTILKRLNEIDNKKKCVIFVSALKGITDSLQKLIQQYNYSNAEHIININKEFYNEIDKHLIYIDEYNKFENLFWKDISNYIKSNNEFLKNKILGYGEIFSSFLLNIFLKINNIDIFLLDSYQLITSTINKNIINTNYWNSINKNNIFIGQGYICSDINKNYDLLGRGGSDTSGSIMANYLNATIYEIWTDVPNDLPCEFEKRFLRQEALKLVA